MLILDNSICKYSTKGSITEIVRCMTELVHDKF